MDQPQLYQPLPRGVSPGTIINTPPKKTAYTFIIYEQLNSLLDALDGDKAMAKAIFHDNALEVYKAR